MTFGEEENRNNIQILKAEQRSIKKNFDRLDKQQQKMKDSISKLKKRIDKKTECSLNNSRRIEFNYSMLSERIGKLEGLKGGGS